MGIIHRGEAVRLNRGFRTRQQCKMCHRGEKTNTSHGYVQEYLEPDQPIQTNVGAAVDS